ncbi:hypothetical protein EW146_g913 [Bondarzewia mesenterica]|uniref:Cleavage stimulation factor subunit 2 hinge domain-containing protein n=1 Tax=Bondarzewia mesenterica TaxID=1095465 RepID=A0A4S4M5I1_9AGAM|nr:hypothetical protein EW146_g913 [Bondarzewia mesenterica]
MADHSFRQGLSMTETQESLGGTDSVNLRVRPTQHTASRPTTALFSPITVSSPDLSYHHHHRHHFFNASDHDTAQSAVRNLNNVDVGGRPLRIDLADSDPFLEGKTTVRGELIDGGETRAQWREREREGTREKDKDTDMFLRALPLGVPMPPGVQVLDMISQTLATMNPGQLVEVLAQMKAFVITHPEQARALLVGHPQLSYALFQALLLNKIVDPAILQRMLAATNQPSSTMAPGPAPTPSSAPPPTIFHAPQPQQPQFFQAPPPSVPQTHTPQHPLQPQPHQPMQAPSAPYFSPTLGANGSMGVAPGRAMPQTSTPTSAFENLNIDASQRAMLLQVLSLTPEQINQLPPTERDTIMNLVRALSPPCRASPSD